jgi:hypothetical protein
MLHHAVNKPMSKKDLVDERNFIFETAHLNRYGKEPIQKLHKNYMRKRCIKEHATLRLVNKDTEKFFCKVTNKLVKDFSKLRNQRTKHRHCRNAEFTKWCVVVADYDKK